MQEEHVLIPVQDGVKLQTHTHKTRESEAPLGEKQTE